MSKIGKINITIPDKVKVVLNGSVLNMDGPLGKKSLSIDLNMFDLKINEGKDISIRELANLVASLVGYQGKIVWDLEKPDGTPRKLLNIERIEEMGWKPKISLKNGILMAIEEYKKLKL